MPQTEREWKETAADFERMWNFNLCISPCDGKHVAIVKPPGSGSLFYNYKGFFSVILFAVVNANYAFLYIQTSANGSIHESAVLKSTTFYKKLINNDLNLPTPCLLPETNTIVFRTIVPYVFLADSEFALNRHFMKPFPFKNISNEKRIFNYGILASRFKVLRSTLNVYVDNVDHIILACCALHNYLRKSAALRYIKNKIADREDTIKASFHKEDWRNITEGLISLKHTSDSQRNTEGNEVREKFVKYFNSEGSSFQDKMVNVVPM